MGMHRRKFERQGAERFLHRASQKRDQVGQKNRPPAKKGA
jgi:hypothetical protein